MKKVLSAVLTAALLVSTVPAAFAASDIDGHWAKSYITELHDNGIINPSASTGNYGPDDKVTRWEFMRYINRAFGFTEKADISFSDVNSSDIFYETVQIAVKQGYINGVGNKVSDCILLFGLGRVDSFPVDVWIKRIMEYCYFDGEQSIPTISAFAEKHFGDIGGFAQQYLFFYARENKIGTE